MDIHSLDSLVRAYISAIVAEATLPLIRRIEELELKLEGMEGGAADNDAIGNYLLEHDYVTEDRVSDMIQDADFMNESAVDDAIRDAFNNATISF